MNTGIKKTMKHNETAPIDYPANKLSPQYVEHLAVSFPKCDFPSMPLHLGTRGFNHLS